MSLPRDKHPGTKLSSLTQSDGDLKINGKFAIGFKDGQLVDQYEPSVMDQGLASGFFDITRMAGGVTNTSSLHMRLESDRIHGKTGDYGINLNFIDSEFGDVAAYTYKKASIDGAIQYLSEFVNDTNNSQHVLYHYIAQLAPIFGIISGTTPLGSSSSKEDAKRAVLSNLSKYSNVVSFPNKEEYDSLLENIKTNPDSFHSLENTIRITLDLTGISESFTEPFDVVIDFNGTETSLINIRIENLKWDDKYAMLDVGIIDAYDDDVFNFKKAMLDGFTLQLHNKNDLQNKPYIDLSDLPILLQIGINTTKNTKYHFSGNFYYNLTLTLNGNVALDFYIEILDEINPKTGLFYVICYIKATQFSTAIARDKKASTTSIFIKEQTVYIKKRTDTLTVLNKVKSSSFQYFKCLSDQFVEDILYHITITVCSDKKLLDFINKNQSTELPTKPLDFIQSFKNDISSNKFIMQIKGSVLGGISIDGPVEIFYDPVSKEITELNMDVSLFLGIFQVTLNMKMMEDNSEYYNKIYNNFIYEFENNPKTRNLQALANKDDTNNIYTENNKPSGTTGVLGGLEPAGV